MPYTDPKVQAAYLRNYHQEHREAERESRRIATDKYHKAHPNRINARRRERYSENPNARLEQNRTWQTKHPEIVIHNKRDSYLGKHYGMDEGAYLKMLTEQGGKCLLCKATDPGRNLKSFSVDHDHQTGEIRGLLCHRCNTVLGQTDENIGLLKRFIAYIDACL